MSDYSEDIKRLSDEIVKSLPFLLNSRVNEAASVVIYNNMEECLKLSSSVSDMHIIGNAFQLCVNYAKEYNIDGLMKACSRWNNIACEKLDVFKGQEILVQEPNVETKFYQRLDSLETIVNDPNIKDKEMLEAAMEEINKLEDDVKSSTLSSSDVKSIRYRLSMLRESLNVSLVIIADLSSVRRLLLNNARR